ncbi:cobyrinate a,c-diamide synthase [Robertmurraya korlensis]|uniref:cobyrinate a,c-diamide synthase n=1 Tax=Robertmurraya korlensis TaxID=519977 RepID=UPI0008261A7B|nr:cobyrinate a,c-diamide synthase [Robertmurraya korlensis]
MSKRRLVIAGTGSGVGKTTLTIGLMSAFKKKGLVVQGFKCGPDYIDPSYHTAVTGRPSRNLDSWMLNHELVKEIANRGSEGADISIIEGVMGFYDGKNPTSNDGTTAEISVITQSPVVLVVNCASMARSAAAIVKGFQTFSDDVNIVAVIANRVGSVGHYKLVKAAVEQECGIPVIGYLKREDELSIPERHLGLIPSIERGELEPFFQKIGDLVLETIDVDKLYDLAQAPEIVVQEEQLGIKKAKDIRIAIARDAAFNFYYQENLEMLESYGAELVEFSPLNGECLPEHVDGLYIGGGFPEEFVQELSQFNEVKYSIKIAIENGLPTLAECGGFMYLTDAIGTTEGQSYPMIGLIPGVVQMHKKLAALGYREISGEEGNMLFKHNLHAKGHEFHYSTFQPSSELPSAYQTKGMRGLKKEGFLTRNLVAGYTHLHFGSCPEIVENWVELCRKEKESRSRV